MVSVATDRAMAEEALTQLTELGNEPVKTLDPYQVKGANWLAEGPNVLYLADQMRVGKTPQCVAACNLLDANRVLVICPGIARGGWLRDFAAFSTDPDFAASAVILYSAKDADKIRPKTRLVIVSYELAAKGDGFAALFARGMVYGFDVLIIDEAHMVTSREAKRTKAIFGPKCTGSEALAGLAGRVWFVSGTPQRRDPSDLFPFCRMAGLWPKSQSEFIDKFCASYHNGYEHIITGAKNVPTLQRLIQGRVLRRLRSQIADVKLHIGTVSIEGRDMSPVHDTLARLAKDEPAYAKAVKQVMEEGTFANITMRSISSVRRLIGMAKVPAMVEMINRDLEVDPNQKIVIFGIHRDPLRSLRDFLRPHKAKLIFGGTSQENKDHMVREFHNGSRTKVMLCNLATAATAIDLSCANRVYIFEPSWIPIDNAQALSRIINIRDTLHAKEAIFVGLADSIDDAVTRVCERRTRDIKDLFLAV